MKINNSSCVICGENYLKYELEINDDSDMTYIHYRKCPNCGYDSLLDKKIIEILKGKMDIRFSKKIIFRQGYSDFEIMAMDVNFEGLSKLILEEIQRTWPRPKIKRGEKELK